MSGRNIVLLCLDTVRKDYFDEYAPRLQNLTDISFDQCRAASSWTLPSHASMITGELPHNHGVHVYDRDFTNIHYEQTFFADLSNYRKYGISSNFHASSEFGFDGFFDEFREISMYRKFPDGIDMREYVHDSTHTGLRRYLEFLQMASQHDNTFKSILNGFFAKFNNTIRDTPLPAISDQGTKAISKHMISKIKQSKEPFFFFANYMEAHEPFEHTVGYDKSKHNASNLWSSRKIDNEKLTEEAKNNIESRNIENYRGLYGASIDYVDKIVSNTIKKIQEITADETTIIITADHGENLGYLDDNHRFGHGDSVSEGLLHVPLCIINPPDGYKKQGGKYFSHTSLHDLIISFSNNKTQDFSTDTIVSERPGSYNYRGEDRTIRVLYNGSSKLVWDSNGNIDLYKLDNDAPCKQKHIKPLQEFTHDIEPYFTDDIHSFSNFIRKEDQDVVERNKKILKDLGYL